MAILDNSGDIIMDTVLTDAGRERLARGDGSFRITKFALFDEEIDYGLYDKNHSSGSAYYDVELLQTLILEAFTNNTSLGNSKLITISRKNLLYLPILKPNEVSGGTSGATARHSDNAWLVAVDGDTEKLLESETGVMFGENSAGKDSYIRVDQGLDTNEITPSLNIDPDLYESQYILKIDNRLGKIVSARTTEGVKVANVSYVDDDNIAVYFLNDGIDKEFVSKNNETRSDITTEAISGPRGTILMFKVQTSVDLNTSTYLFETLGSSKDYNGSTCYYIDSYVTIEGGTTGYRIELPVRFVKKQ